MPELPEVETIKRGLTKRIVGKKIVDIEVIFPKTFIGDKSDVEGQEIVEVDRRAKVLAIKLKNSFNLLFHLKMTGQLVYRSEVGVEGSHQVPKTLNPKLSTLNFSGGHPDHNWHVDLPNSTTAIIFDFDDGSKLYFNDLRKFGWCKVLSKDELERIFTDDYGPEPFDPGFNAEYLMQHAVKIPNRKIKQFLTDQSIVAGIGNIYIDELLFDAKISPLRKVSEISKAECEKIIASTIKILNLAIEHGGTTDSDFVNADGEKGGMQDYLKVYRKTGTDCPNGCGHKIERTSLGGRGTHYCPKCQK